MRVRHRDSVLFAGPVVVVLVSPPPLGPAKQAAVPGGVAGCGLLWGTPLVLAQRSQASSDVTRLRGEVRAHTMVRQ
jgi:hypothetical protein